MLRSMFAAVTGLRSHQAFMDVVGNNIANVNTTGYKIEQRALRGPAESAADRRGRADRRQPVVPTPRRSASVCVSPASASTSRRARRS